MELRIVTVITDFEMEISPRERGVDFLLVKVNSLTGYKAKKAN